MLTSCTLWFAEPAKGYTARTNVIVSDDIHSTMNNIHLPNSKIR